MIVVGAVGFCVAATIISCAFVDIRTCLSIAGKTAVASAGKGAGIVVALGILVALRRARLAFINVDADVVFLLKAAFANTLVRAN